MTYNTAQWKQLLSVLPFSSLLLILDYLPPYKYTLTLKHYFYLSGLDDTPDEQLEWHQVITRTNFTQIIKTLYGYFKRDPYRSHFLIWVNLDVINIDLPISTFTYYCIPWRHVKYFKFVNDYNNYAVTTLSFERNPFFYAGNQVLHSMDLSYWNWRTVIDRQGILTNESTTEFIKRSYEDWSNIRSLNLSNTLLPACSLHNMINLHRHLVFLDLRNSKLLDLSNNSKTTSLLLNLKLKKLLVTAKYFGSHIAHHLMNLQSLYLLYVQTEAADEGCLSYLSQNTRLRDLTFTISSISFRSSANEFSSIYIPKFFFGNFNVERLELSDTFLTIEHSAQLFTIFPNVTKLFLHQCGLDDSKIIALVFGMKDCIPSLDSLDITYNLVEQKRRQEKGLRVRELGLNDNFFTCAGLRLLCLCMPNLSKVSINENNGNLSYEELEEFIQSNDDSISNIEFIY